METYGELLRVRAWYSVFRVATAVANQESLMEIRTLLLEALQAVEKAEEETHGG